MVGGQAPIAMQAVPAPDNVERVTLSRCESLSSVVRCGGDSSGETPTSSLGRDVHGGGAAQGRGRHAGGAGAADQGTALMMAQLVHVLQVLTATKRAVVCGGVWWCAVFWCVLRGVSCVVARFDPCLVSFDPTFQSRHTHQARTCKQP